MKVQVSKLAGIIKSFKKADEENRKQISQNIETVEKRAGS